MNCFQRYVMACGGRPKMPPKYDASYLEKSATVPSGEAIRKYAAKISKRSSTVINDALNIGYCLFCFLKFCIIFLSEKWNGAALCRCREVSSGCFDEGG